ncbi:RK kinase, partial [Centropus unirufus]|nr:RK kinase [Centropus unirufus]
GRDGGGGEEASFRWQCVEQPIGKLLFRRFLERAEAAMAAAGALWEALEELERCERSERGPAAEALRLRFLGPRAAQPCAFLSDRAAA